MWWYLPLVLLPLPIAPAYFLVLFILSTTLHARPCFYCVILLTALFLSSCYWPPVPIGSSLSTPWSDNITTFADALLSRMPELPREKLPTDIPIVDHCWCDVASGNLFEPFNITNWELESVERLKRSLEVEMKKEKARDHSKAGQESTLLTNPDLIPNNSTSSESAKEGTVNTTLSWGSVWGSVWPFSGKSDTSVNASSVPPQSDGSRNTDPQPFPSTSAERNDTYPTPTKPESKKLIRREYDLRPYGFDMIVDFSWSRRRAAEM
ncbi:unnamed protein product [Somion occarium]|uniref:Uncharacterized protein n=1 Tax=Somion occarium TaxID=3059160 RepID=A0ABP1CLR9_9APHY